MKIDEPEASQQGHPLWYLAFRAGFLTAGIFAVAAMLRWLWWMEAPTHWDYRLPPNWWHAHEMVFGFALPVVAGFLLTAVANWTDIRGTRGRRLQILFGLWLAARLLLWLAPGQLLLPWAADMGFILLLTWELGSRVWTKRQWRNMWFPPILLALAALDSVSFLRTDDPLFTTRMFYGTLWMIAALVVIIGGRVIPLFTANRLGIKIPALPQAVEYLAIVSILLIGLVTVLLPWQQHVNWFAPLCLAAGAIHLYRLHRWQGWKTLRIPLLWSMHLSYLCIPLALFALALSGTDPVAVKNTMHLLAIGTIGGMILTMMSRVSLGHTGRSLDEVPAYIAAALGLLLLSALVRAFLPMVMPEASGLAWRVSAILWIIAFGLFLWRYIPILTRARVDGKPG